jgi:hypothetical protein
VCTAAVAALTIGLAASGCARSSETQSAPATSSSAAAKAPSGDIQALVPTPANTTSQKGPDSIPDNGIHQYFEVNGVPGDVMNAFKTALQAKGWEVTTIVSSGGGHGGGGATYTGTHGDAYGVFDGGGYKTTTYIDVCTWPSKPANPNCQRGTDR